MAMIQPTAQLGQEVEVRCFHFCSFNSSLLCGCSAVSVSREALTRVLYGEAPPQGPNPYTFIYHFLIEKVPLSYTFTENCTPFSYLRSDFY